MGQTYEPSKVGINSGQRTGQPRPNYCVAEYDFATDGGAQGDIACRGDTLPANAYVVDCDIIVETAFTSGGAATVAVKAEGAADINAADAISGAPWSTAGAKKADKLDAADEGFKTTADRAITITVGTADLTAGKAKFIVKYWLLS